MKGVNVHLTPDNEPLRAVASILARHLRDRAGVELTLDRRRRADLTLVVRRSLPREGYAIEDAPKSWLRVAGGSPRGLLYGVGALLRTSRFGPEGWTPGAWRGRSAPAKPFRAIYFATHFHNFYHDAPVEKVERYVEDLGLWGYNAVMVWYDMHHFQGFDDLEAARMRERLRAILRAARRAGLQTGLTLLANEGYASTPERLRLVPPTQIAARGMYGVEVCPSKPGGEDLILQNHRASFEAFRDPGIDIVSIWPYDQGGCGCRGCAPWGANGFLRIGRRVASLARATFPGVRVVLSTWLFDTPQDEGEWRGLSEAMKHRPRWVDMVLADSHTTFPLWPIEHGSPGGLPLVNFPEISMWGMSPWGGRGANPLPARFEALWRSAADRLSGGFPYSEGIFEDINKAVYSRFYWSPATPGLDAVREYAAFEFGPPAADDVVAAVKIMEANHTLPAVDAGSAESLRRLDAAAERMTASARSSWRWRILYLRAVLDREHYAAPGARTRRCEEALRELIAIYHAERAEPPVRPPL